MIKSPLFTTACRVLLASAIALAATGCATTSAPVTVAATIASTPSLSTLNKLVDKAGLSETLKTGGPFTVFAPTNAAFAKLPAGTVETLLKPENKAMLTGILTYHVVAGKLDAKTIEAKIKEGKGKAELTTVAGGKLWVMKKDGKFWLKDEKGGMATVTIGDVYQSNGIIHVIDSVVLPK